MTSPYTGDEGEHRGFRHRVSPREILPRSSQVSSHVSKSLSTSPAHLLLHWGSGLGLASPQGGHIPHRIPLCFKEERAGSITLWTLYIVNGFPRTAVFIGFFIRALSLSLALALYLSCSCSFPCANAQAHAPTLTQTLQPFLSQHHPVPQNCLGYDEFRSCQSTATCAISAGWHLQ